MRRGIPAISLAFLLSILSGVGLAADLGSIQANNPQLEMENAWNGPRMEGYFTEENEPDESWSFRRVSQEELDRLHERDPELYPRATMEILARLNARARYYIAEDIKNGTPLKVPRDLSRYKKWTAVPADLPEAAHIPKFILIVKDAHFLGWYENGSLVADSLVCVGWKDSWTKAGIYKVLNKNKDAVSRSYPNAYGQPAPMPWAMRIYGAVYIHAGDIESGNCSHGCINLPWFPAVELFNWADFNTVVMIVDSVEDLDQVFDKNQSNCLLYAEACPVSQKKMN